LCYITEEMSLLKKFLLHIAVGVLGFFLAEYFLDITIKDPYSLFYAGLVLGVINFFIRPVICLVTFPLRLLTLGLFTFIINISIVWFVQAIFPEIIIDGFSNLIYTTLIVWMLEVFLHGFSR